MKNDQMTIQRVIFEQVGACIILMTVLIVFGAGCGKTPAPTNQHGGATKPVVELSLTCYVQDWKKVSAACNRKMDGTGTRQETEISDQWIAIGHTLVSVQTIPGFIPVSFIYSKTLADRYPFIQLAEKKCIVKNICK